MNCLLLILGLLSAASLSKGAPRALCGGETEAHEAPGSLSPDYANNMDCTYSITGNGSEIELTFPSFDVESASSCNYDYVEVRNANNDILAKLCGTSAGTYVSTAFTIRFKTDSSVTKTGFTAAFAYYVQPVCNTNIGTCKSSCGGGEISNTKYACQSGVCCVENPLPDAQCGTLPASFNKGSRIVNGEEATAHSWPWQVSLQQSSGFHFCGGSLIAGGWVVTAAHCVSGWSGTNQVVLGEHDRDVNSDNAISVGVNQVIMHPAYAGSGGGYPNDIALLQLSEVVTFNDFMQPACVPVEGSEFDTHSCSITGWGDTKNTGDDTVLQELPVQILSKSACSSAWSGVSGATILDTHVCLIDDINNIGGACNGDSGGPLSCQVGTGPFWLVGATSWGINGCITPNYPAVYTRVSEYRTWIVETIVDNI